MKLLSEELGIRSVTRSNNDIALYTDSGVTLFESVPRAGHHGSDHHHGRRGQRQCRLY